MEGVRRPGTGDTNLLGTGRDRAEGQGRKGGGSRTWRRNT